MSGPAVPSRADVQESRRFLSLSLSSSSSLVVIARVNRAVGSVAGAVVDEYAERVVEGRRLKKMQFRSATHGTEILLQSRPPRRGVASRCRRRRRDATPSLPLPVLRIGPLGPVTAEGCSRKWSACPTNTGRSTAT
ncbi:hypothetical protein HN011_000932 [Eciton burchellii]|nr:hypothetical protein HN011_000932 [Eciton burchellii]